MTKLVSTLIGAELALWVARAVEIDNPRIAFDICRIGPFFDLARDFCPHEDWADAGPLIEQYTIAIGKGMNQITYPGWHATVGLQTAHGNDREKSFGPTPLVAAMRALVASVYGKEVPNEENT